MAEKGILNVISDDTVINKIYEIRGLKVMLDSDLAELYGVETRVLNQAVQRNLDRFPKDFMFQLSDEEWAILKSQFVIRFGETEQNHPTLLQNIGPVMASV